MIVASRHSSWTTHASHLSDGEQLPEGVCRDYANELSPLMTALLGRQNILSRKGTELQHDRHRLLQRSQVSPTSAWGEAAQELPEHVQGADRNFLCASPHSPIYTAVNKVSKLTHVAGKRSGQMFLSCTQRQVNKHCLLELTSPTATLSVAETAQLA